MHSKLINQRVKMLLVPPPGWPKSRRANVVAVGTIVVLVKFGAMSVEIGHRILALMLVDAGPHVVGIETTLVRCGPQAWWNVSDVGPNWVNVRPTLVEFGPSVIVSGPKLVDLGPNLAETGRRPNRPKLYRFRAKLADVGRSRLKLEYNRPRFERIRPVSAPFRPSSTRIRPYLVESYRSWPDWGIGLHSEKLYTPRSGTLLDQHKGQGVPSKSHAHLCPHAPLCVDRCSIRARWAHLTSLPSREKPTQVAELGNATRRFGANTDVFHGLPALHSSSAKEDEAPRPARASGRGSWVQLTGSAARPYPYCRPGVLTRRDILPFQLFRGRKPPLALSMLRLTLNVPKHSSFRRSRWPRMLRQACAVCDKSAPTRTNSGHAGSESR